MSSSGFQGPDTHKYHTYIHVAKVLIRNKNTSIVFTVVLFGVGGPSPLWVYPRGSQKATFLSVASPDFPQLWTLTWKFFKLLLVRVFCYSNSSTLQQRLSYLYSAQLKLEDIGTCSLCKNCRKQLCAWLHLEWTSEGVGVSKGRRQETKKQAFPLKQPRGTWQKETRDSPSHLVNILSIITGFITAQTALEGNTVNSKRAYGTANMQNKICHKLIDVLLLS